MTHGVRRHVAKDDVRGPAKHFLQARWRGVIQKIQPGEFDIGDRLDFEQIDCNHSAAALPGFHALSRYLTPASRRRTEIEHLLAGLQDAVLVVDLDQLEGGA
jgi:hypothetical protein